MQRHEDFQNALRMDGTLCDSDNKKPRSHLILRCKARLENNGALFLAGGTNASRYVEGIILLLLFRIVSQWR